MCKSVFTISAKCGKLIEKCLRIADRRKKAGPNMKIDVMGVRFDNVTMDEALARADALLAQPGADYCVTPNAEMVYEAMHDPDFAALLNEAALVLPDGAGAVLGAKILGTPLKGKVAGIEFAEALARRLAVTGGGLYLLGGKPGIAELAGEKLREKYPGLTICGTADGYFQEEAPVVAAVNAAAPAVLFVCLGSPKQERFMRAHQQELNCRLMIGLGGSLDGFAGKVKRAPKWMIRMNLEWLYRLIKEPSRFGRMLRLPKFVLACKKQAHKNRKER